MTSQQKLTTKVSKLSVAQLKEIANSCFNDTREGAEIVMQAALDRLMALLPEAEFVAFCDAI